MALTEYCALQPFWYLVLYCECMGSTFLQIRLSKHLSIIFDKIRKILTGLYYLPCANHRFIHREVPVNFNSPRLLALAVPLLSAMKQS